MGENEKFTEEEIKEIDEALEDDKFTVEVENPTLPTFPETRVIGNMAKESVRVLLGQAGYDVYPFGYESYFTSLKDLMHTKKIESSKKTEKLRSMPDIVVLDRDEGDVELVEVKFRDEEPEDTSFDPETIIRYEEYWPKALLICVTTHTKSIEGSFFGCRIEDIRDKARTSSNWGKNGIVDVRFTEEDHIKNLFPKIREEKLNEMKNFVSVLMKDWKKRVYEEKEKNKEENDKP